MKQIVRPALIIAILTTVGTAWSVDEENNKIGFSSGHVFEQTLDGESVDVMTGNVTLEFPIGPHFSLNDWFGYQLKLYYNSKIWDWDCEPGPWPSRAFASPRLSVKPLAS